AGGAGKRAEALREAPRAELHERIERDLPVRRELAARDADHARGPGREHRLPSRAGGRAVTAGQNPQATEGHAWRAEPIQGERRLVEDLLDVVVREAGRLRLAVVLGVGGA